MVVNDMPPLPARHRDGVPVLRALSAHDRLRQHGLCPEDRGRRQGHDRPQGQGGGRKAANSRTFSTACPRRSRAGSVSAWRSAGRSCATPRSISSTSRFRISTPHCASPPGSRSRSFKEQMPESTMIYVTHDQVEAMTLATRIVVLAGGGIAQVGSPLTLYERPASTFVAQFIGSPAMKPAGWQDRRHGRDHDAGTARGRRHHHLALPDPRRTIWAWRSRVGIRPEDMGGHGQRELRLPRHGRHRGGAGRGHAALFRHAERRARDQTR